MPPRVNRRRQFKRTESFVIREDLKEFLQTIIPELDIDCVARQLAEPLSIFSSPQETLSDGAQCFIPAQEQKEIRHDYIWMPHSEERGMSAGYYHWTTKEANIEVYSRLQKVCPQLPDLELEEVQQ